MVVSEVQLSKLRKIDVAKCLYTFNIIFEKEQFLQKGEWHIMQLFQ